MKGRWRKYLSALLAAICGIAFGWFAGLGVARAEAGRVTAGAPAIHAAGAPAGDHSLAENHSSRRFQPSSASVWR